MPHQISIIDAERMMRMWKKNRWMRPERVMALGFLALILLGGVLLSLPCAAQNGRSIGLGNGLFTATSAVCVTGLVAVDTGTTFSLFGQITLLALIQIGGLGFMAFATLTMMLLGRKIGLRDRMLLRESMNTSGMSGLVRLTRWSLRAAARYCLQFASCRCWAGGRACTSASSTPSARSATRALTFSDISPA